VGALSHPERYHGQNWRNEIMGVPSDLPMYPKIPHISKKRADKDFA